MLTKLLTCQSRVPTQDSEHSMQTTDPNAIRSSLRHEVGGKVIAWLIYLIGSTLKLEIKGEVEVLDSSRRSPLIYALWHNRLFVLPYAWRKCHPSRKLVALASASKDGAALEAAVREFGMDVVRGSSSRRAVAALVAMKKAVNSGNDGAITPDGPRGPKYKIQPGIVKLAQSSGCPIVMLHVDYHGTWKLKTWDGFLIPRPFSHVEVILETFLVPKTLTAEEFESVRVKLEKAMMREEFE